MRHDETQPMPTFETSYTTCDLPDRSYIDQPVVDEHSRTQRIPRPARATLLQWIPVIR